MWWSWYVYIVHRACNWHIVVKLKHWIYQQRTFNEIIFPTVDTYTIIQHARGFHLWYYSLWSSQFAPFQVSVYLIYTSMYRVRSTLNVLMFLLVVFVIVACLLFTRLLCSNCDTNLLDVFSAAFSVFLHKQCYVILRFA